MRKHTFTPAEIKARRREEAIALAATVGFCLVFSAIVIYWTVAFQNLVNR